MKDYFTVTRKVAIGYLVIVFFSLAAIGYALLNLYAHTKQTESLVGSQFKIFTLQRDLSQNLLAQEKLEKQLLILHEGELLDLLELRFGDFETLSSKISSTFPAPYRELIDPVLKDYPVHLSQLLKVLETEDWKHSEQISIELTSPLRSRLLNGLTNIRVQHQDSVDQSLRQLSQQSNNAYRFTLLISMIGIFLSAPVALTVITSIRRSVRALQKVTREIAAGSFESRLDIKGSDEFGLLALDFASMGRNFESWNSSALMPTH